MAYEPLYKGNGNASFNFTTTFKTDEYKSIAENDKHRVIVCNVVR